jgi:tRNA(fMet)-specific endonuclease VapC
LTQRLEAVLGVLEIAPFDAPADDIYGQVRARLERTGTVIGGNDLLIAAQALALGDTVVTDNEREFRLVPALTVENWLRD